MSSNDAWPFSIILPSSVVSNEAYRAATCGRDGVRESPEQRYATACEAVLSSQAPGLGFFVAHTHQGVQRAVSLECGGIAQPTSERVHRADVRHDEVRHVRALAPQLGVEVDPARREPALLDHHAHHQGSDGRVREELIRVPAGLRVSSVGVDVALR
jgi:hypothetical protein